jgi:hypothetical protein
MGLQHLRGLRELRELWLTDTSVSYEAVEDLQHQLPDCQIHTGSMLNPFQGRAECDTQLTHVRQIGIGDRLAATPSHTT